jgi:DNA-binding Lrp family transcriptional regulator
LILLQEGLPLTARPYRDAGGRLGLSEDEIISRIRKLKEKGIIKRIDFRLNLKKLGMVNTLVACKVSDTQIPSAKDIILNCRNVTHNYLREHELNMWFTLGAASNTGLGNLLVELKERLRVERLVSFMTKRVFKLGFRLKC